MLSHFPFLLSGDYEVSIKFNNEHIPDSPFIVPVATLSDDARRLTVTSLQVSQVANMLDKSSKKKTVEAALQKK